MRFKSIVVSLAILIISAAGCAKAPPSLSPKGKAAFEAKQAVEILDIIRDFAVGANAQDPPLFKTEDTRKVVLFHQSALKVIEASPDGWKPTVQVSLAQLKVDLPANAWKRIQPYVDLLAAIMKEVL